MFLHLTDEWYILNKLVLIEIEHNLAKRKRAMQKSCQWCTDAVYSFFCLTTDLTFTDTQDKIFASTALVYLSPLFLSV